MIKKYDVRWKETLIVEKKAEVYAESEDQAIDMVQSGNASEETMNEVVDDYYEWQSTIVTDD
jgi:hypothetical protein